MRDAFEACQRNTLCSQQVPSKMSAVNEMALELMNQEGLSRREKNKAAEDFMNKALYSGEEEYPELHREIYKFYDRKLTK